MPGSPPDVDLLIISRDLAPLRSDVQAGIDRQVGVCLAVHRIAGTPCADDPNRWATIARARNAVKRLGSARWAMFLDDDVVLADGCVERLVAGLATRGEFASLAADSAGEMRHSLGNWDYPQHVGMAAAMFRRERLAEITFRWQPGKCECRCCCEDLRRTGFAIGYMPGAVAWHRPNQERCQPTASVAASSEPGQSQGVASRSPNGLTPRILAAFDRRDADRFRRQFLRSLRATGNPEPVTAVAYGVNPAERARLAVQSGVNILAVPGNVVCPSLRRLHDFQEAIARLPDDTPVAYWDAGDVVFQENLEPLWELVRTYPDKLLVARESKGYPENPVIVPWTNRIRDPAARRRAFAILAANPFLNSGFAAGTVRSMMRYLRDGDRMLNSDLKGVDWWGDQVAMNVYCYGNPNAWQEIPEGWNYSLAGRDADRFRRHADGRVSSADGAPVHVLHGNAGTLRQAGLPFLL